MKFQLILDKEKEESCVITAHNVTEKIRNIEKLINEETFNLVGYIGDKIYRLDF